MFQVGKSDIVKISNLFPELIYPWDAKPIQIALGLKKKSCKWFYSSFKSPGNSEMQKLFSMNIAAYLTKLWLLQGWNHVIELRRLRQGRGGTSVQTSKVRGRPEHSRTGKPYENPLSNGNMVIRTLTACIRKDAAGVRGRQCQEREKRASVKQSRGSRSRDMTRSPRLLTVPLVPADRVQ